MPASRTRPAPARRRDAGESARAWLGTHRLRCTGPRLAMVAELIRAQRPLSITQLHKRVADVPCDFATVFRFMERLRTAGLVRTHYWDDRQPHFELEQSPPRDAAHHHHLVCRRCRRVVEVHACGVDKIEKGIRAETGFTEISHSLEFFGICPTCAPAEGEA